LYLVKRQTSRLQKIKGVKENHINPFLGRTLKPEHEDQRYGHKHVYKE